MPEENVVKVRYVEVNKLKYLYIEDVKALLEEFACTEDKDTADRIQRLISNIGM